MFANVGLGELVAVIGSIVGATAWIVNSINGVKNEVQKMREEVMQEIQLLRFEHNDLKHRFETHIEDRDSHK